MHAFVGFLFPLHSCPCVGVGVGGLSSGGTVQNEVVVGCPGEPIDGDPAGG